MTLPVDPDDGCEYSLSCLSCPLKQCKYDAEPPEGTPMVQAVRHETVAETRIAQGQCRYCSEVVDALTGGRSKTMCTAHADAQRLRTAKSRAKRKS